jgi:hypothetical protein
MGRIHALNSLCGISLNATHRQGPKHSPLMDIGVSLNSLCGISLNATKRNHGLFSQAPIWDKLSIPFVGFLWMQRLFRVWGPVKRYCLSIPFVGFLWMQQKYIVRHGNPKYEIGSQFPFWDFFECNRICVMSGMAVRRNDIKLSIPFVGFLWMQPTLRVPHRHF